MNPAPFIPSFPGLIPSAPSIAFRFFQGTNSACDSQCEKQEAQVVAMRKHDASDNQCTACSNGELLRGERFEMFHATSLMSK